VGHVGECAERLVPVCDEVGGCGDGFRDSDGGVSGAGWEGELEWEVRISEQQWTWMVEDSN